MPLTFRNKATKKAQERFSAAGFYSVDAGTVDRVIGVMPGYFANGLECCSGTGEWLYRMAEICKAVDAVEIQPELVLTHPSFNNVSSYQMSLEDFTASDYELVVCNPPFRSYVESEKRYLFVKLANIAIDKLASKGILVLARHPRMKHGKGGFAQLNERLTALGQPLVVSGNESCDFLIYGI